VELEFFRQRSPYWGCIGKKCWTKDIGNNVVTVIVFRYWAFDPTKARMCSCELCQIAANVRIAVLRARDWWRYTKYDAPKLECRLTSSGSCSLHRVTASNLERAQL